MASRFQRENSLFDGRPQPFSAGHSLALEGESPIPRRPPERWRRPARLSRASDLIGIALGDGAQWHAVGSENHRQPDARLGARLLPASAEPFRKGIDQQRMIVPALDEINREWKTGRFRLRPTLRQVPAGRALRWSGSCAAQGR